MAIRYRDDPLKRLEGGRTEVVHVEGAVRGQGEVVRQDKRVDAGDGMYGKVGHELISFHPQNVLAAVVARLKEFLELARSQGYRREELLRMMESLP